MAVSFDDFFSIIPNLFFVNYLVFLNVRIFGVDASQLFHLYIVTEFGVLFSDSNGSPFCLAICSFCD